MFGRLSRTAIGPVTHRVRSSLVTSNVPIVYNVPQRFFWSNLFKRSAGPGTTACKNADESPSKVTTMTERLKAELNPAVLQVEDVSGGCGAFFKVLIVSDAFTGKATLARHRLVQGLLKQDIADMHGITLTTLTPQQYEESKKE